jgi:uncharacterized membrane protein (UPF0127 family)
MVNFNFKLKNKKFSMDVFECKNIFQKASGLMFRKKSKPLLFIFNKSVSESIHSFFCFPFIGIWFNRNEIVDIKYVRPWKINIKPLKKFDKLLEIPRNSRYFNSIELLIP